jgi:hypothetical protein
LPAAALSVVASDGFLVAVNRRLARFYLGSVGWFVLALVPYVLCALIWLPARWQSRASGLVGMTTSGLLLLYAAASSAWRMTTDQWGRRHAGSFRDP